MSCRKFLEEEIDASDISDILFEENIFDVNDHDDILDKDTPEKRGLLTVEKIFSRGNFADDLIYALEESQSECILRYLDQQRKNNENQEENT